MKALKKLTESQRAYIYRIFLALLAAAVLYGVIAKEDVPTWIEVGAAILGLGGNALATANTNRKPYD